MKYLIADIVVEYAPKYEYINSFLEKFKYNGTRKTDIEINLSNQHIESLHHRMVDGTSIGNAEAFAVGNTFFKKAIPFDTMLVHSSALVFEGKAYLFSAMSGVGKSTHTKLWQKAFGERVQIINDDKPAVRIVDGNPIVYGTPFDGGSGIAENDSAPLGAIIFLKRSDSNFVEIPSTKEILQSLYFSTVHMLSEDNTEMMLSNFEKLIGTTKFYILNCNTDISAAYTAYNAII